MPIYEYKCRGCDHKFSVLQRMGADGSELTCPQCEAAKPEKVFSAFASSGSGGESYAPSQSTCSSGFG